MNALLRAARTIAPLGWAALASMALAAGVVLTSLPGLISAAFAPAPPEADGVPADAARLERFRESFAGDAARIAGRSMFFAPPAPAPPPPPPDETAEPAEAPPPERYAGPAIIAMINGRVWFDNGTRLSLDDAESAGLRVISLNAPWSARILWSGSEWDVPLFDRTTERFLEKTEPDSAPAPGPAPETTPDE